MRAYKSCASGRCGWRSSPVSATRWAVSSWPFWRNSSPSRRNTRLSGSWASWEDRVLITSGMRARPGEGLGGRLGAAHFVELLQLRVRAWRQPFPLVPLLYRLAEPGGGDERVPEYAVRGDRERIEPQRAAQLFHGIGPASGQERDPPEQQVHVRVVGMDARGLLGRATRLFEVAARERVLGARHELDEVAGECGPLALGRARVRQHDHTGALQPEQGLRDLEVRASQLRCDAAHVALAVDHRQHLPLGRQQIELTFTRILGRREHGHDAEVRDAPLDAGPFVDAPRPLHQQRLGGDAHHGVRGQLGRSAFAEREVPLAPAHDLEDDLFDLEAYLALELARGERAERHQDLAEPAAVALALLHVARALEIGFG